MRDHLVFLLSAPIASFGGYAGHERRGSETIPMRSAVLGLVGAAVGIDRADAETQASLRTYSVAVQAFQRSRALQDYHTVQTIPTAKAKRPASRSHAFRCAGNDVNTIVTIRGYRCDVLVGAALWGNGRWTFDELASHLRRPKFPLYVGRKSCPLANPLNPKVVTVQGPAEALACIEIPEWLHSKEWSEQDRMQHLVHSDAVDSIDAPPSNEQVPGEPLDRQAWTFGERVIWHLGAHLHEQENPA